MYCPECGTRAADQARFCVACGTRLGSPVRAPFRGDETSPEWEYSEIYEKLDEPIEVRNKERQVRDLIEQLRSLAGSVQRRHSRNGWEPSESVFQLPVALLESVVKGRRTGTRAHVVVQGKTWTAFGVTVQMRRRR